MRNFWRVLIVAALALLPHAAFASNFSVTSANATPSSATQGQTITFSVSVQAASAASDMLLDLEVHNGLGASTLVAQKYFTNQSFAAGQTRTYTWNYAIPAGANIGTYYLKAGVFTANWASLSYWTNAATTYTVAKIATAKPAPIPDPIPTPVVSNPAPTTPAINSSPSGTTIPSPSATQIVDSAKNIWTVVDHVVDENGKAAGYSANVTLLLYYNGVIYQENAAGGWWSWGGNNTWNLTKDPRPATGGTASNPTSPAKTASASGTEIPDNATQIVDAGLNTWTVAGGVVDKNGAPAGYSANVKHLLYKNGLIYQENAAGGWWSWSGSQWNATSNPNGGTTPVTTGGTGGSGTASTGSGSGSNGGGTVVAAPPPDGSFGIQILGNKFVSKKDGTPIQLVGANVSGLETSGAPGRWLPFANAGSGFWNALKNEGYNVARIPLNEAYWLGNFCGQSASTYQATVKTVVAEATDAGLYIILDLHWAAPNIKGCPSGQGSNADADNSPVFWSQVADTFKNNPAVMFELFNEPFGSNVYSNWLGSDLPILQNGGSYPSFLYQNNDDNNAMQTVNDVWSVAGMQSLVYAIRATGATNVIISNAMGWAGEIETWLQSRPNDPIGQLAAGWHVYGYNKGTAPPLAVLHAGYPIVITETYGLGAIGGWSWARSQGIGYLCWGVIDSWGGSGSTLNPGNAWSSCPGGQF